MLNDVLVEGIARHTDYELADVRDCYRLLSKEADSPVTLEYIFLFALYEVSQRQQQALAELIANCPQGRYT